MAYTIEIKDENGNIVSKSEIHPQGGDKKHVIVLDENLNMRQEISMNSMQEVRDFEIFWKDERDIAKLTDVLDGKKRFTDVDACSEVNGYIVNLEFKNSIADIQDALAQIVKAVREAKYNNTFTYFVISNGDVEELSHVIPIFPNTIKMIEESNIQDLQCLVQRSNPKLLKESIQKIEKWTLKEENLREDDAFNIAKKIQNAVHHYNMKH